MPLCRNGQPGTIRLPQPGGLADSSQGSESAQTPGEGNEQRPHPGRGARSPFDPLVLAPLPGCGWLPPAGFQGSARTPTPGYCLATLPGCVLRALAPGAWSAATQVCHLVVLSRCAHHETSVRPVQPSLRDLAGVVAQPNAEALGYCQLSLRDSSSNTIFEKKPGTEIQNRAPPSIRISDFGFRPLDFELFSFLPPTSPTLAPPTHTNPNNPIRSKKKTYLASFQAKNRPEPRFKPRTTQALPASGRSREAGWFLA